jgi:SAM-dependent methyltransferase
VAWLAGGLRLGPAATLVEQGAGTGKLTGAMVSRCRRVVAVEPGAEMRRELAARVPGALVVGGVAEAIPVASGAAASVACAQAFHWFATPGALAEIHRVLSPGGRLGLAWNQRDESVEWVARLAGLLEPLEGKAPRFRSGRWREALRESPLFGPLQGATFATEQVGPPELVVERTASTSFVAALPPGRREEVLEEVRRLLATHPATAGRPEVRLPYVTHVHWCERR